MWREEVRQLLYNIGEFNYAPYVVRALWKLKGYCFGGREVGGAMIDIPGLTAASVAMTLTTVFLATTLTTAVLAMSLMIDDRVRPLKTACLAQHLTEKDADWQRLHPLGLYSRVSIVHLIAVINNYFR